MQTNTRVQVSENPIKMTKVLSNEHGNTADNCTVDYMKNLYTVASEELNEIVPNSTQIYTLSPLMQ